MTDPRSFAPMTYVRFPMNLSEALRRARATLSEPGNRSDALTAAVVFIDSEADPRPEDVHKRWVSHMVKLGFRYGFDFSAKSDPRLLPFDQLSDAHKKRYDQMITIVKSNY
jgi:hypothetical protein